MRVMIAGVGYPFLRDQSVGSAVVPLLRDMEWPAGVEIEDWSFGPIAIVQRLEAMPTGYDRIVFVSSAERGHAPGRVSCHRWAGRLPDADEIQRRIGEAVMGVISLDNLLVIGSHFRAFPEDVRVVEIEPEDCEWGEGFTPTINSALETVVQLVRQVALEGHDG
jgi:hydrogenase maturation protease